MKLYDLLGNGKKTLRRGLDFTRNPTIFFQRMTRLLLYRVASKTEIPGTDFIKTKGRKKTEQKRTQEKLEKYGASFKQRFGLEDQEKSTNSKNLDFPAENSTRSQNALFETKRRIRSNINTEANLVVEIPAVEIPPLQENQEIRGRRGRYRCVGKISREGEQFRLYPGIHSSTNQPVLIKEYLLPEIQFNRQEIKVCKTEFAFINEINLKSPSGQDFRIAIPLETIAPPREKRCYSILEPLGDNITLKEYIAREGALTPSQVVEFLDQVLQTLWFLHTRHFSLIDGSNQNGTAHGNLNLDTIFIVINEQSKLLVYLADLALWEHIFLPPNLDKPKISYAQDLIDLGAICASLLLGKTEIDDRHLFLGSDDEEENWLEIDEVLGRYILQLLQLKDRFDSALTARQELLRLKKNQAFDFQQEAVARPDDELAQNKSGRIQFLIITATVILLSGLFGAAFVLFNRDRSNLYGDAGENVAPCCMNKVNLPAGNVNYAAEKGIWSYILERPGFVSSSKTIKEEFQARQPLLQQYSYQGGKQDTLAAIQKGEINFALGAWNNDLPEDLEQEVVAFHGIAVYVAFSDDYRQESIPSAFNGKISIKQLRRLYTEGTENWDKPRKLKDWDIKLYVPFELEAVAMFEQLLFLGDENSEQDTKKFLDLADRILSRQRKELHQKKYYLPTTRNLIEKVFIDFEQNKTVGIGFGYLNSVFGQCAVYPLAIAKNGRKFQPYATTEHQAVTPEIDLCDDKGGYLLNVQEFHDHQYPFGYSLVVTYPKDEERSLPGKQFAKLLKTQESQYLLKEAGLVPLRSEP